MIFPNFVWKNPLHSILTQVVVIFAESYIRETKGFKKWGENESFINYLVITIDMSETVSPLERNVGYVVSLVKERTGELDLFELTKQTRLRHDTSNPLGLKDARDAITEAEQRGLIQARTKGFLYGDMKFYYPSSH